MNHDRKLSIPPTFSLGYLRLYSTRRDLPNGISLLGSRRRQFWMRKMKVCTVPSSLVV